MKSIKNQRYSLLFVALIMCLGISGCAPRLGSDKTGNADHLDPQEAERKATEQAKKEFGPAISDNESQLTSVFTKIERGEVDASQLSTEFETILKTKLAPERIAVLLKTKQYQDLATAFEHFKTLLGKTKLNVKVVPRAYDVLIAFKKSTEGTKYEEVKQKINNKIERHFEEMSRINELNLMGFTINYAGSRQKATIVIDNNTKRAHISLVSEPERVRTVKSIYSSFRYDDKKLLEKSWTLEGEIEALENQSAVLKREFCSKNVFFNTNFPRTTAPCLSLPFDTSVEEDAKKKVTLVQSIEEIKKAQEAFLALGR